MNRDIAERVMGLQVECSEHSEWLNGERDWLEPGDLFFADGVDLRRLPDYATDPAHMMEIANAVMQRWGAELTIGTFAENRQRKAPRYRYLATLRGGNVTYTRFDMQAGFAGDNPAALVCEAALYAAAHAVEGEADE